MKLSRALGLSAAAASLILSGCSTATEGRAQQDTATTSTAVVCPSGTVLTKIGKCDSATTTTSPTAAPNANPTATLPSVSACDGTQCDLSTSDDEVDRLVSEALDDVTGMWAKNDVNLTLHMYKNGIGTCDGDNDPSAAAWVCIESHRGGWNSAVIRDTAAKRGATLSDTVRSIVSHEVGHVVLGVFNADRDDLMTDELRADCMGGGYSRWTMLDPANSAMGQLTLERTQNVLYGSKSVKAVAAGYHGTPSTCTEYTP